LYENGRFEDSINQAIEIIKRNNNWNENQAFNLLNEIFNELGNTNELVVASRKKLSEILN
jgi:thioredoxin-like negative regulator of GroEL